MGHLRQAADALKPWPVAIAGQGFSFLDSGRKRANHSRGAWISASTSAITNITTTQRYMHLDEKELADAQDLIE